MPRVIRFDDTCYHSLKPTILRITQAVYNALDPHPHAAPLAFDAFFHFSLLSYEPVSSVDPTPRRIYIIIREGTLGTKEASVRFVLNVLTGRVHDRVAREFVSVNRIEVDGKGKGAVGKALEDVRAFACKMLQEEKARVDAFASTVVAI